MRSTIRKRIAVFMVVSLATLSLHGPAHAAAPGAPTGLTGTAGNLQVALSWTAPVSTGGGGGISAYNVEYTTTDGLTWVRIIRPNDTTTTYTATGLTNGTSYTFRVSAVNATDVGPFSNSYTTTPYVVHTPNDLPSYSACPPGIIPTAGFTDTTSTDVDCIKYYGITKGTTDTTYSPQDTVTRWQMALFLTRMATRAGVTLPSGTDQGFSDISGKSTEIQTAINQIRQLGITVGKTATTYAPDDKVTRQEMALFMSRYLEKATVGPGGNTELGSGSSAYMVIKSLDLDYNYTDITHDTYEIRNAIVNLWNLGVTDVQLTTKFEPTADMTRLAMATFMTNALAHTSARPKGLVLQSSSYRLQNGNSVTLSVTHRTDDFQPIANTYVDTFAFNHSIVATIVRFNTATSNHTCTVNIFVTLVSSTKCTVDTSDPKTDASGNLAEFLHVPPSANKVDFWAWTSSGANTVYNNNVHGSGASKITVETHP